MKNELITPKTQNSPITKRGVFLCRGLKDPIFLVFLIFVEFLVFFKFFLFFLFFLLLLLLNPNEFWSVTLLISILSLRDYSSSDVIDVNRDIHLLTSLSIYVYIQYSTIHSILINNTPNILKYNSNSSN